MAQCVVIPASAERHTVYDLETYPNIFTATFIHCTLGFVHRFEVSDRRDDIHEFVQFIFYLKENGYTLVGYNNIAFDNEVLHFIIQTYRATGRCSALSIYTKVQQMFEAQKFSAFGQTVPPHEWIVPQIDLFKIWHFDNKARRTSLKALEFNMCSESVEDLPFPPGTILTFEQMDTLLLYNFHDVTETLKFYWESRGAITMREEVSAQFGINAINSNDTKIGKSYFIKKLEEVRPGCTGTWSKPNQTLWPQGVPLRDVIFSYVQFVEPEFNRIKEFFKQAVVTDPKGFFKDEEDEEGKIAATVGGLRFIFGSGGIHASVSRKTFTADADTVIFDIDVSGFYARLPIVNRLYPAHLGSAFCDVYEQLGVERKKHKKGSPANAMLKLANNGVYGDSGNKYSPFYDIGYLLSITVNGQLLLCMLAEQLIRVPSLQLIQVNTDGITVQVRRDQLPTVRMMMQWWMGFTKLELEEAFYSKMCIRDVNNYIAVKEDGTVAKRKGAYSWVRGQNISVGELAWHMDHSALVVPMAAEAALLRGEDITQFIHSHTNIFDFMIRGKVPKGTKLMLSDGEILPNIIRYYVSTNGKGLKKLMPVKAGCVAGDFKRANKVPDHVFEAVIREIGTHVWDARIHTKNRSKYDEREQDIEAGYVVSIANQIKDARFDNINYNYYIVAAQKLVQAVQS